MKVKVNENIYKAISYWEETLSLEDLYKDFLFRKRANVPYFTNTYECLNELSKQDMIKILKNGYELKEGVK